MALFYSNKIQLNRIRNIGKPSCWLLSNDNFFVFNPVIVMEYNIWIARSLDFDPLQMPFVIEWVESRFLFLDMNFSYCIFQRLIFMSKASSISETVSVVGKCEMLRDPSSKWSAICVKIHISELESVSNANLTVNKKCWNNRLDPLQSHCGLFEQVNIRPMWSVWSLFHQQVFFELCKNHYSWLRHIFSMKTCKISVFAKTPVFAKLQYFRNSAKWNDTFA